MAIKGGPNSPEDYTVGLITALPIERAAATAILDSVHGRPSDLIQIKPDANAYTLGSIGEHNVVIASLAAGLYGTTSAASTAIMMLSSFPNIRVGLLVGIGAGIPNRQNDIRLGDVVVSQPSDSVGGVFQYDLGKIKYGGWERKDYLNAPPEVLLKALAYTQAQQELGYNKAQEYLEDAYQRNRNWARKFGYPKDEVDRLFMSSYEHVDDDLNMDCASCLIEGEIERLPRDSTDIVIHYGVIGSGNTMVKDARVRETIASMEERCICLEMEAAGLMTNFPCLVIRGISDYADSHKNDAWQRYASAAAASVAKEILEGVGIHEVCQTSKATEALREISSSIAELNSKVDVINVQVSGVQDHMSRKENLKQEAYSRELIQTLYTCPYAERKNRNICRVPGTCEWFINHPRFQCWLKAKSSSLLWVSADPGCGKSVLARYLVDEVLSDPTEKSFVGYFFFRDDFLDQRSSAGAIAALLHQLITRIPSLITPKLLGQLSNYGSKIIDSFSILWEILINLTKKLPIGVVFILDALDECREADRSELIQAITSLDFESPKRPNVRWLVSSRPYNDILRRFQPLKARLPTIHLSGEDQEEVNKISEEITLVIKHRVQMIGVENSLTLKETAFLEEQLTSIPHRTYLWVHLTMDVISHTPGFSRGTVRRVIKELPKNVNEAYEKILCRSPDERKARRVLGIIVAALEPLTVDDLSVALTLTDLHQSQTHLDEEIDPPERMQVTVRELCGLFVNINDSKIYLLHQTAREFLVGDGKEVERSSANNKTKRPKLQEASSVRWIHSIDVLRYHQILASVTIRFFKLEGGEGLHRSFRRYSKKHWIEHFYRAELPRGHPLVSEGLELGKGQSLKYWKPLLESELLNPARVDDKLKPSSRDLLLIWATWAGYIPLIKMLLATTTRVNLYTGQRPSALWWASRNGDDEIVELLLKAGAHVENQDLHKSTLPLEVAAYNGHTKIVNKLLLHNANPNLFDKFGRGALYVATIKEYLPIVELLLKHGAYADGPRKSCIYIGRRMDICGGDQYRPLLVAVSANNEAIAKTLLVSGANPWMLSWNGSPDCRQSPLLWLSKHNEGHGGMVKLLIEQGRPSVVTKEISWHMGLILLEAIVRGSTGMIEFVLKTGIYKCVRTDSTPKLFGTNEAAKVLNSRTRAIRLLYSRFATLVHAAAWSLRGNILSMLLIKNVQPEWLKMSGKASALYLAMDCSKEEYDKYHGKKSYEDYNLAQKTVVKMLIKAGADPARSGFNKDDYNLWAEKREGWVLEAFKALAPSGGSPQPQKRRKSKSSK